MTADNHALPAQPTMRVLAGDATAEEIAALLAVIGSRADARAGRPTPQPAGWNDRTRSLRSTLPHGAGAWSASGRPR
jgi:hypothetical protein